MSVPAEQQYSTCLPSGVLLGNALLLPSCPRTAEAVRALEADKAVMWWGLNICCRIPGGSLRWLLLWLQRHWSEYRQEKSSSNSNVPGVNCRIPSSPICFVECRKSKSMLSKKLCGFSREWVLQVQKTRKCYYSNRNVCRSAFKPHLPSIIQRLWAHFAESLITAKSQRYVMLKESRQQKDKEGRK